MKNIGLFGDSFTGSIYHPGIVNHWSTLLAKYFSCELTNFGDGGTSIYESYKRFLLNHEKFDCVIFLVTDYNRYISPVKAKNHKYPMYIPGLSALDAVDEDQLVDFKKSDLKGWFVCSNETFNFDMAQLMLDKIISLRPDVIIVPCAIGSISEKIIKSLSLDPKKDLSYLQRLQIVRYGKNFNDVMSNYKENLSTVSGHLSPEMNNIFFNIIKNRIINNVWNWDILEKLNFTHHFDELYVRR